MTANPETKLQFNFKTPGGDLHNIYAGDEDEAAELLEAFGRLVGKVAEISTLLRVASGASAALSTGTPAAAPAGSFSVPQQASAPAQETFGGVRHCPHGPMTLKSSAPGASREWSAWMCPARRGADQCQPIDAKTGQPWPKR